MRIAAALAGVACLASLVATAIAGAQAGATEAGPDGKLVFAAGSDGPSALFVANADGTGFRRLLGTPGFGGASARAAWSADGTKVAFDEGSVGGIWVASADGSGLRRVTRSGSGPVWSPDGSRIAFSDSLDVYVVEADGDNRTLLGNSTAVGAGWLPAWSPDGRQVGYGVGHGIVLVDVRNGNSRGIPTSRPLPGHVAWSPDGAMLAFVSGDGLFVVGVDGRGERRLARHVGYEDFDNAPAWSPDGHSLVFEVDSERDYGSDAIFTVRVDGSRLRRLTPETAESFSDPVWSPDGRRIAFNRTRIRDSYGSDVFVVNVDGTGLEPITHAFPDDLDFGAPSWTAGRVTPARRAAVRTLRPARLPVVATSSVVDLLDQVGTRGAAVLSHQTSESCALTTWGRRPGPAPPRRIAAGNGGCVDELALSPTHTYWTLSYEEGHSIAFTELWARSTTGRSRPVAVADHAERSFFLGNLRGDASIQVYNTWWGAWLKPRAPKLWRLNGKQRLLIGSGPDSAPVIVAGGERIAVLRPNRSVVILDGSGRRLRAIPIRRGAVHGAALDRDQLVLLRRAAIEAYSLRTGRLRHRRAIDPDPWVRVTLHDAHGDVVVYSRGVAITLLRLSSGRSAELDLPNQAGPTDAALEADGLYYSYNVAHTRRPGRIAFVPRAALEAALG